MAQKSEQQPPVKTVRFGAIKASVWANPGKDGMFYNVSIRRSYKDGENWKDTDSFGRDDLLTVAKVCDEAHSYIFAQQAAERAKNKGTEDTGT